MILQDKKILIAITGGIAAYKINLLVRSFIKEGAEVQVIMTPAASNFVSPLTLSTLSKKPVYSDFYSENGTWNSHVDLALWADLMIIAPCTANTLAKMMHGQCDNLVIATYLSAKCPVFIAPAMDLDMYAHPSTRQNLEIAEDFGHFIIPAEDGELASGLIGEGRMAEPETIIQSITDYLNIYSDSQSFAGKTVLITAGPTYEAIDPVRFIGNHSSGKMGFAIAEAAAARGAQVILISGPTSLQTGHERIQLIRITSAQEMYDQVFRFYDTVDVAIASAAVADYAPANVAAQKIKKSDSHLTIELIKNPDILAEMGLRKNNQFLVGFALETENEEENARGKLERKNLDMIVLNSLSDAGAGFGKDTNLVKFITSDGITEFGLKSKQAVAADILEFVQQGTLK
ncbi:bifunctional phosphopantothenoylcysteine decarboxylase/phosphopantothenate--cysteine ligase CoaBC [Marnyiella aurantia]|uniref:Coenzyme A biosynthesis bifunctional protein CoaBC n=1 Tax=Marnyiella aurantia TaxID=2758037 RepID=A0A7D7LS04_9FLAO|nr:bifunctional phosphopantothenoylcysteine decarboxylase/phosphopantothenate--cysteine ligase CoaBC [Marnyiella aurantia]MBA5247219.1 bifunctional phosphopantothenoylcysteine decarboxylase/phosphopantothenate--cysteine ligase CoaBC [Marnyiella aurantia]QMS97455.1 bifunctional phosphopantothenoylcysteine decarboxylase/phosphopantothenate--cysteine ligase CoaBC [Marnyiella aurantia]